MKIKLLAAVCLISASLLAQNVGIGINSGMNAKLHVASGDSAVAAFENLNALADSLKSMVYLRSGGIFTGAIGTRINNAANGEARLGLYTFANADAGLLKERLSISDAGAVGINNLRPYARLDVGQGRLRFTGWVNENTASGVEFTLKDGTGGNGFMGPYTDSLIGFYGFQGSGWSFVHNNKNGNVGLQGNVDPRWPLSFAPVFGAKITLFPGQLGQVGFGVQGNLFQMYSDYVGADIAFGYGGSNAFTENMRIKGNGNVGIGANDPQLPLDVNGRMRLRFKNETPGIWFNKEDNSNVAQFFGTLADTMIGFYNAQHNGWRHYFDTKNGRIGIDFAKPQHPLSFASVFGDKISFASTNPGIPNSTHYGIGLQASLLQLFTASATDDIAFGFGRSGAFTERMRVKGNGNVGIGVSAPTNKLEVAGSVRIADGTQGSGKIFTSDANGVGSWQNAVPGTTAFRTSPDANFAVPGNNSVNTIPFKALPFSRRYDDGLNFSNATSEYVVPAAGTYNFTAQIEIPNVPGNASIAQYFTIMIYGTNPSFPIAEKTQVIPSGTGGQYFQVSLSMTAQAKLAQGEPVKVAIQAGHQSALNINSNYGQNFFSGYRIL